MKRYVISIPQSTIHQLPHSDFRWTFTIFHDYIAECRAEYVSRDLYKRFNKIEVNDIYYENIIFDFRIGKLIIETDDHRPYSITNVLENFKIHTPTSQAFFLTSRKSGGVH